MFKHKITYIILFAFVLLLFNINKPFIGHHDWNGAFWGNITRNYLYYISRTVGNPGWIETDNVNPGKLIFFYHYTPLMPVLFTIFSFVFGLSETSLRLVTVLLSLLMVYYIYKIGKHLYCERAGLIASMFAIVTPMFLYFGKLPDHEPILTPFCTAAFYHYLLLEKKDRRNTVLFYLFLFLSLMESWGGFFFLVMIILHWIIFRRSKINQVFLMIFLAIFVIGFHFSLIVINYGTGYLIEFLKYGLIRMDLGKENTIVSFSPKQFIETEARYIVIYFTRILVILSGLWFIRLLMLIKKKADNQEITLIFLFLYGAVFILVFRNLAFIHDYKLYLLLPFISLSSAITVDVLINKLINPKIIKNIIIIIVLLGVFLERRDYLKSLITSSFDKAGYDLGKIINVKVLPREKVLISSVEFDSFYGHFMRYYANREITVKDLTLIEFQREKENYQSKYRYIIFIDNRPADESLKSVLMNRYPSEKAGAFTFIDLSTSEKDKV